MPNRRDPAKPERSTDTADDAGPVEVRLIGHEATVHRLAEALTAAAGPAAGPVAYRPSRYGPGIRAYLTVAVLMDEQDG